MSDCGCEPGKPCDEAIALWRRAEELRDLWRETRRNKDWLVYLAAKQEYDAHRDKEKGK